MMNARTVRTWYRLHKWTSLICTVFLLIACITGLPLVFSDELNDLLQPHVHPASLPASAPVASLDRMVEQTRAIYPMLHPFALGWDDDEPRIFVSMTPVPDPKPSDLHVVIFDAHTGRKLEQPNNLNSVTTFLLRLHRELFLDLPGELFMGVMALCFVISLISGALVYGPFMRRLRFGTYRTQGVARTRWFDLHNLVGIITLAWTLVVGATGVMNALSIPLFNLWRAQTLPALLAPYRGKPLPNHLAPVDVAVDTAAKALPGMEISSVLFPNPVFGSPRHYVVWTRGKTAVTSRLFTPALIDAEHGTLTVARALPWYLRTIEVSRPLHFGDYGGLPLKIIWALLDVMTILVLVSGVYLWVSKRNTPVANELDQMIAMERLEAVR